MAKGKAKVNESAKHKKAPADEAAKKGKPNMDQPSKTDAVREALRKLGADAQPADIDAYLRKTHGIEMTKPQISSCKFKIQRDAAGKTAGKSGVLTRKAKSETSEVATDTSQHITKMEAVRRALDRLGQDAKASAVQEHIKQALGLDIDTSTISTYRGLLQRRAAGQSGLGRQAAGGSGIVRLPWGQSGIRQPAAGAPSVEDLRTVKELTGRLGPEQVKELADVMAP